MNTSHPFIKYAIALVMQEHNIQWDSPDWNDKVAFELNRSLQHFRVKPKSDYKGKEKVDFTYSDQQKGDTNNGVYLSPNILTPDKTAGNIYKSLFELKDKVKKEALKNTNATMSIAPIAGEYLSFGEKDTGRGKPKITNLEAALCLITATTPFKPSMAYKRLVKKKIERTNTAIIPDLELKELKDFIDLFKRVLFTKNDTLLIGRVYSDKDKNGNIKSEKPQRPRLHDGNYPNAPSSSALGSIGLLGAIGEWAKEADEVEWANRVLDSLKNATMSMISYGNSQTFSYNHYIIDLAKADRLKTIIDSLYYSELLDKKRWQQKDDYEKFDLFTGRFLLLYNRPSFQDFLSFRAEYPVKVSLLFNTYFIKMENISPAIVASARALGKWLNYVAYIVAKQEVGTLNGIHDYWEKIRKQKAKVLVELESSTFSARTGDALIAQAITRAGRLSGMDAPEEAALFMEKTCSGELELDNAKNLLIAFSRLINRFEKKENPLKDASDEEVLTEEESSEEDFSDAQE
jgi:CRISPR-associated protein Cas8c/Csp2